jgi:hypothetical protein
MRENLQQVDYTREDRCGETPHPARETRALPLNRLLLVGWLVVALNGSAAFAVNVEQTLLLSSLAFPFHQAQLSRLASL